MELCYIPKSLLKNLFDIFVGTNLCICQNPYR